MLPPALKRRQLTAAARACKSSADIVIGTGAASAAAAAAAAVFMELRKPLVLSWDVEVAPTVPAGLDWDQTSGAVVIGAEERRASVVLEGGEGSREMESLGESRGKGVAGVGEAGEQRCDATGGKPSEQEGLRAGLEGTRGDFECARPRDPAWARLVFADRKR